MQWTGLLGKLSFDDEQSLGKRLMKRGSEHWISYYGYPNSKRDRAIVALKNVREAMN